MRGYFFSFFHLLLKWGWPKRGNLIDLHVIAPFSRDIPVWPPFDIRLQSTHTATIRRTTTLVRSTDDNVRSTYCASVHLFICSEQYLSSRWSTTYTSRSYSGSLTLLPCPLRSTTSSHPLCPAPKSTLSSSHHARVYHPLSTMRTVIIKIRPFPASVE